MPQSEAEKDEWDLGSEKFKFIHTPARLQILATLAIAKEADFLFIIKQTGLTRGTLSSHMSKLESEELIEVKKEFDDKTPKTILRLTDKGRIAIQKYRQTMLQVLDELDKPLPLDQ